MIPNFPTPYDDELLYSVVARHAWLVQPPSQESLRRELFGHVNAGVPLEFPGRLRAFQSVYGPRSSWDVPEIIQHMTVLPYYAPFLPPARIKSIETAMFEGWDRGLLIRAGIVGSTVPKSSHLRVCPSCIAEERSQWGEAYWHRLPHLPGVHVCPVHQVFLETTRTPVPVGHRRHILIAAEDVVPDCAPKKLDCAHKVHATLLRIANNAARLASSGLGGSDPDWLRERYLASAMEHGYASGTGCVRWSKLIPDFRERYSPKLLEELHCRLPEAAPQCRDHWIACILQKPKDVQAPIRHLLLMDFFGLTPAEFFNVERKGTIFGIGPWECRNSGCAEFGKPVIQEITIAQSESHHRPMGILRCPECGQERYMVDLPDEQRIWIRDPHPIREKRIQADLVRRREIWLDMRKANPLMSMTELIEQNWACYIFLYRHDRDWLRENSPASRRRAPAPQPPVDWAARDAAFANEAMKAIQQLNRQEGPPQQITITAIGKRMGKLGMIQKYLSKMPLTQKAIRAAMESAIDFAKRKVAWAGKCLLEEEGGFNRRTLIRKAGLSAPTLSDAGVQKSIELELVGISK